MRKHQEEVKTYIRNLHAFSAEIDDLNSNELDKVVFKIHRNGCKK
jgi:hypothetical protein